ncbi:MAG: chemotaxis protein CheW [Deltaproteobacteria bacterium]|uniref:Chemotaxis protein CheW n=1 Tax=Candidatus Zymogenus saltonus TaxID=2844893 RepID=A0A9D8PQ99_9DELT|nr:chemotaxis protein CheW [Candidatus Zymogenus saltonus]
MAEVKKSVISDRGASSTERQIIAFKLGGEIFGIDISNIERIAQFQPVTLVPRAPDFISGIMNLGGSIITLVNLSKILNIPEEEDVEQIIILENETMNIGILAGLVTDVITVDEDSPDEGLIRIESKESSFVSGVFKATDKIVNVLNIKKIFNFIESSFAGSRIK